MSAELVAGVLLLHSRGETVETFWGLRAQCACGDRLGELLSPDHLGDVHRRHVAERVVEALAHGAPAVAGEVAG